jgi:hypothetical protein
MARHPKLKIKNACVLLTFPDHSIIIFGRVIEKLILLLTLKKYL